MSTYVLILTVVHVAISLVALVAGFVATVRQILDRPSPRWTLTFLWMTVLTTVTGFMFPFKGITGAFVFGILSTPTLIVALYAIYRRHLMRPWNWIYAGTATFAFYLNFFAFVAQLFLKVPPLRSLAPTGTEPAFAIAQGITLIGFLTLGVLAIRAAIRAATPARAVAAA